MLTNQSWRTRETDLQKGINDLKKQFVKGELMNYHYYKACWEQLEQKRIELNQKYENRLEREGGGSIIKLPDGSSSKSPWQIEKTGEISDLLDHMALYEHNLRVIDSWLDCLSNEHRKAVLAFYSDRLGEGRSEAAESTDYSDDGLKSAIKRAVEKIVGKFL